MSRRTYANVVATAAVFFALGGAGFAATKLPRGSVGAAQLKHAAVTPAKLGKGAQAFSAAGPQGATGKQGPAGKEGASGKDAAVQAPLAPGATETGVFAAGAGATAAPTVLAGVANFARPLPSRLDREHVDLLEVGEESAPGCPGIGRAEPGFFCAYTYEESNASPDEEPEDPATGLRGANVDGSDFFFIADNPLEGSYAYGTWAVTAP